MTVSAMRVHLSPPAPMPCREVSATIRTIMYHILRAINAIRDTAQTEEDTENRGPGAVHALASIPTRITRSNDRYSAYLVVPPLSNLVCVIALCLQFGQSTGADALVKLAMGVALRYFS